MSPRGRRPGTTGTRDAILQSARAEFSRHGYDAASIRGIAAGAEVDSSLVYHYFANKQALFVTALEFPADPGVELPRILDGAPEQLGERLVRTVVTIWDSEQISPVIALLRSAVTNEQFAAMLRQFITRAILEPVIGSLTIDHSQLRGALVVSQLVGLAMARYVLR
ncbi:MAG: TetR family transcriptional regulator, partial [Mycobacteriales bacterium]